MEHFATTQRLFWLAISKRLVKVTHLIISTTSGPSKTSRLLWERKDSNRRPADTVRQRSFLLWDAIRFDTTKNWLGFPQAFEFFETVKTESFTRRDSCKAGRKTPGSLRVERNIYLVDVEDPPFIATDFSKIIKGNWYCKIGRTIGLTVGICHGTEIDINQQKRSFVIDRNQEVTPGIAKELVILSYDPKRESKGQETFCRRGTRGRSSLTKIVRLQAFSMVMYMEALPVTTK